MAYNNYYPTFAPGWYGQQFYQPIQQPMQQQMQPQQMQPTSMSSANQPQTQQQQTPSQGVFVRVQSEQEARAYPVAPGNSVTFIDEQRPYCYTKAVDMSQLDRPRFDKYRLVKEDETQPDEARNAQPQYALAEDVTALARRIATLEKRMKGGADDEPAGE